VKALSDFSPSSCLVKLVNPRLDLKNAKREVFALRPPTPKNNAWPIWELRLWDESPFWKPSEMMSQYELKQAGGKEALAGVRAKFLEFAKSVAFDLRLMGCVVYRLRIMALAPGAQQDFHVDVPSEKPVWRFHVPILTHENALIQFDLKDRGICSQNLPASGHIYLLNIATRHRVINLDQRRWRVHLVGDFIHWNQDMPQVELLV
jgi:hypothetical protein